MESVVSMKKSILRSFITNNSAMSWLSFVWLICGVSMGVYHGDFYWINRFGSLVICSGIILMARPVILGQRMYSEVIMATGFSLFDDRHYDAIGERVPEWLIQERITRISVGWLGPVLLLVGTLATGFGDLFNGLRG